MRTPLQGLGPKENFIFIALYSFCSTDGVIQINLGTHVDDLLWASLPEAERIIDQAKLTLRLGREEIG